jgi:hypothetical protein
MLPFFEKLVAPVRITTGFLAELTQASTVAGRVGKLAEHLVYSSIEVRVRAFCASGFGA